MHEPGIAKRASGHALRHPSTTCLLDVGHDFRTVQELLGHEDVSTMMLDTHAGPQGGWGVRSPVNQLAGGG